VPPLAIRSQATIPLPEERSSLVNEAYAGARDPKRRAAWEAGLDPLARPPTPATDPLCWQLSAAFEI